MSRRSPPPRRQGQPNRSASNVQGQGDGSWAYRAARDCQAALRRDIVSELPRLKDVASKCWTNMYLRGQGSPPLARTGGMGQGRRRRPRQRQDRTGRHKRRNGVPIDMHRLSRAGFLSNEHLSRNNAVVYQDAYAACGTLNGCLRGDLRGGLCPKRRQAGRSRQGGGGQPPRKARRRSTRSPRPRARSPAPAGNPECVWLGRRVVSLLWRDDLDTAFRHLDLYDRFGCPSAHIQATFRCLIRQGNIDPKAQETLNGRVHACWLNPALAADAGRRSRRHRRRLPAAPPAAGDADPRCLRNTFCSAMRVPRNCHVRTLLESERLTPS